jgi:microcystin-dependent protein
MADISYIILIENMSDYFLGEIRMFGFNFAPRDWAMCQGQSMPIQQNAALYSLLGIRYGGDGKTVFQLPDLRGRVPISQGIAVSGTLYELGNRAGVETLALTAAQAPPHTHDMEVVGAPGTTAAPSGLYFSGVVNDASGNPHPIYAVASGGGSAAAVNPATVSTSGGGAHNNMQPFSVLNFCISLVGIYPPHQ